MSGKSHRTIGAVRLHMLERGFALVDTPRCFDDGRIAALTRSNTVLPCDSRRWWRFPQLSRYACWLEWLLAKALPEESLALTALEFRHEQAGAVDDEVDRLHADGSYLRSICTLYGLGTIYRAGGALFTVPRGQTLLLTAMDRARAVGLPCTLHRRPGAGPERAVIVCSYEPRTQHASNDIYRQVALVHGMEWGPETPSFRTNHPPQPES
jgi:hypothetical protein